MKKLQTAVFWNLLWMKNQMAGEMEQFRPVQWIHCEEVPMMPE
jgi:hypothetical protein